MLGRRFHGSINRTPPCISRRWLSPLLLVAEATCRGCSASRATPECCPQKDPLFAPEQIFHLRGYAPRPERHRSLPAWNVTAEFNCNSCTNGCGQAARPVRHVRWRRPGARWRAGVVRVTNVEHLPDRTGSRRLTAGPGSSPSARRATRRGSRSRPCGA